MRYTEERDSGYTVRVTRDKYLPVPGGVVAEETNRRVWFELPTEAIAYVHEEMQACCKGDDLTIVFRDELMEKEIEFTHTPDGTWL